MLYVLFFLLAIIYNWRKFQKDREEFIASIINAKSDSHRDMILSHHFYVFIFEGFLSIIVANFISEKSFALGMLSLGGIYFALLIIGYILYRYFVRYIERKTNLELYLSFQRNLFKELRVNIAIILVPILLYSIINSTFLGDLDKDWGNFWFIGLLFNFIFVSVLTIICSVIIMLKLIPNREITEDEYLNLIQKRLNQINLPYIRARWIETDIKNAFVAGLKILNFSNQTMFVGKNLRTMLTIEEFDAIISHELAHVANRHIHKRVIDLLKNLVSIVFGCGLIMISIFSIAFLYWGEDFSIHTGAVAFWGTLASMSWIFFNYMLLFDVIRSHEFEADAYAVLNLGIKLEDMQSALEKLTNKEEIPDYLKSKLKNNEKPGFLGEKFRQFFSTHPEIYERKAMLEYKIENDLPFNYYISPAQKARRYIMTLFHWKISAPLALVFMFVIGMFVYNYQQTQKLISFIKKSTDEEVMRNSDLVENINVRHGILGRSLMYHIVLRRNETLIDYFLVQGADKGKTLVYISQLKDFKLFKKYYTLYQGSLTEDEFFLVLRKSAEINFVEGYRYLVNADRFEKLDVEYKEDIARLTEKSSRAPASVKTKE